MFFVQRDLEGVDLLDVVEAPPVGELGEEGAWEFSEGGVQDVGDYVGGEEEGGRCC